jgi:hypothetical protein
MVEPLPDVLKREINEYIRGDRAHWQRQFAQSLDIIRERGLQHRLGLSFIPELFDQTQPWYATFLQQLKMIKFLTPGFIQIGTFIEYKKPKPLKVVKRVQIPRKVKVPKFIPQSRQIRRYNFQQRS